MAECKQAVLVEKETAHRDCLTGCYDRMTIRHLVDLCFLKSDVRQSHAMFVIDVDNFKRVNDTCPAADIPAFGLYRQDR